MEIFEDDFEEAFAPWSSTVATAGCTVEVESLHPHHGGKNLHALTANAASATAYCRKDFAPSSLTFMRAYVTPVQINLAIGSYIWLLTIDYGNYQYGVNAAIYNNAGILAWDLQTMENNVAVNNLGAHVPVAGTRYCVEIKRDVAGSKQSLWIDGVLEASSTRASSQNNTAAFAGVAWKPGVGVNEVYVDCVAVEDEYIGVEVENQPIVYPTVSVKEASEKPSRSSAIMGNYGARVRHMKHLTPISPWTAE